jgi:hypothetical protein
VGNVIGSFSTSESDAPVSFCTSSRKLDVSTCTNVVVDANSWLLFLSFSWSDRDPNPVGLCGGKTFLLDGEHNGSLLPFEKFPPPAPPPLFMAEGYVSTNLLQAENKPLISVPASFDPHKLIIYKLDQFLLTYISRAVQHFQALLKPMLCYALFMAMLELLSPSDNSEMNLTGFFSTPAMKHTYLT